MLLGVGGRAASPGCLESGWVSELFVKKGKKLFFLKERVPEHCGLHALSQ